MTLQDWARDKAIKTVKINFKDKHEAEMHIESVLLEAYEKGRSDQRALYGKKKPFCSCGHNYGSHKKSTGKCQAIYPSPCKCVGYSILSDGEGK